MEAKVVIVLYLSFPYISLQLDPKRRGSDVGRYKRDMLVKPHYIFLFLAAMEGALY